MLSVILPLNALCGCCGSGGRLPRLSAEELLFRGAVTLPLAVPLRDGAMAVCVRERIYSMPPEEWQRAKGWLE